MKKFFKFTLVFTVTLSCNAICFANGFKIKNYWQARVEIASYNAINWGVECGINYYPIQYVGFGASLCGAGDFNGTGKSFVYNNMVWETKDLHDAVWFRCGMQLQSPIIWQKPNGAIRLRIKEECGITMPVPMNKNLAVTAVPNMTGVFVDSNVRHFKNENAKACFFHIKTSIALDVKLWQVWVGYSWSDLDVYSSVRNVRIDNVDLNLPRKRQLHGINIGVGYCF